MGRAINVMISPLPRNKRAKNPREAAEEAEARRLANSGAHPAAKKPEDQTPENGEPQLASLQPVVSDEAAPAA